MYRPLLIISLLTSLFSQEKLSIEKIMTEPFLWGNRALNYGFSPDGQFLFVKEKNKDILKYNTKSLHSSTLDSSMTSIPSNWINDSTFIYRKDHKLYDVSLKTGSKEFLYDTKSYGSDTRASFRASAGHLTDVILTENRLIVKRANRLSSIDLKGDNHNFYISSFSNSGRYAVVIKYKTRVERKYKLHFPNYLPTFTDAGTQERDINHNELLLVDFDTQTVSSLYSQKEGGYIGNITFNNDDDLSFTDHPVDRRTLGFYIYDIKTKNLKKIYQSASSKWVVGTYHSIEFSPNGKQALFIGLNSGFERLFLHDMNSGRNKVLTQDPYQVTFASWLNDDEIILISNEENPTERKISILNTKTSQRRHLQTQAGYIGNIVLSQTKEFLAYSFSTIGQPDEVYLYNINSEREIKITATTPVSFLKFELKPHEILKTRSDDNKFDIYANFYSADQTRKPLVVFVHGAGIMQNVRNGWTPYYQREYMFNQFLTQQGYHVLDVDYRGSEGYSNDFATDVHSHLGKKELEDIVTFINLLDEKGLIDREHIGIYGGSYGGFMTSYAMAFQPELFKAGAALRSVFKWENYFYTNEWYTRARLGLLTDHPDWYKRSSPIYHAEKIKNPMLILHGVLDDNVPFQDAVQMIQEMINYNKKFDLMIYPKEKHSFKDPKSWIDEYTRIFNYFETYLKATK